MKYVFIIFGVLLGIQIYGYVNFLSYDYASFCALISPSNEAHLLFLKQVLFFTEDKFKQLHYTIPGVISCQFLFLFLIYRYKNYILLYVHSLMDELNNSRKSYRLVFKSISSEQLFFLVIVILSILLSRIYLINRYQFNGDEALAYLTFVQNGFWTTMTYYPGTNNHLLFNLIAEIFNQFLNNPVYIMRLPNVLLNFILLGLGFSYLFKKYNFTTAIVFLIIVGLSFSTTIYAVHGRAYMLVSLCTLLTFMSILKLLENPFSKIAFICLCLSTIVGGFSLPVYMFIFAATLLAFLYFMITEKNYSLLRLAFFYGFIVAISWFFIYLPIFSISGFNAFFNHDYAQPQAMSSYYYLHIVPVSSVEAINFVLGTYSKGYLILPIFLLGIFFTYIKSSNPVIRNSIKIAFIFILTSFLIMILVRNFGEPRVFTMYAFLFYFIIAMVLGYWMNNVPQNGIKNSLIIVLFFVYILMVVSTFDTKMNTFYGQNYLLTYKKRQEAIDQIIATQPSKLFISSTAYYIFMLIEKKINHHRFHIDSSINSNTKQYDYIILENINEFPSFCKIDDYVLTNKGKNLLLFKFKKP